MHGSGKSGILPPLFRGLAATAGRSFVPGATVGRGFELRVMFMASNPLRLTRLVGLLCLSGLAASGCATQSPWWSARTASEPQQAPEVLPTVATSQPPSPTAAQAPGVPADSQQMQDVMAELQRLGALDPAARDQLTADLQDTDPALWPGLLHQARAVAAYRQRAAHEVPGSSRGSRTGALPAAGHFTPHVGSGDGRDELASPSGVGVHPPMTPGPSDDPAAQPPSRLPVPSHTALAPRVTPREYYPSTTFPHFEPAAASDGAVPPAEAGGHPASGRLPPETVPEGNPPATPAGQPGADSLDSEHGTAVPKERSEGQLTSYSAEKPLDWTGHVDSAIRLLEDASDNGPEEEIRLRMLYLAAERYDDVVRVIPALPAGEQDFWAAELHGLGTLLDGARNPDAPSRTAEAKQVLADAASKLGELAPLVVRNLAFCTRVHSYGCFETFASYKFAPEQRVLLYAEVDNFTSESTARGYHTSLKSSYQIFDARGQRVADEELASTEELCQNRRRDFFMVYDFHLPKRIYPGKHTLRLTIEDVKGKKIGDSSIDLEIVGDSASR